MKKEKKIKTMKTMQMKKKTMIVMMLVLALMAAWICPHSVYAATGPNPVTVNTGWTKLCDTKENSVQYIRIEALYPVNLDVKMDLGGGKTWSENCAVRVKSKGMCVRDFYVGKNVRAIYVRVNRKANTHYMTKSTFVRWQSVGRIRYN